MTKKNAILYCRDVLSRLKNDNEPVVLFVENLQMLFEQIRPDLGKLRSVIQSDQSLCIVGSALTYFDLISSPNEPFYKFFDVRHLQGLGKKQLHELIKKRLELSNKRHLIKYLETHNNSIGGIHLLTGGNPRLVHILAEIVIQKNSLKDLERNLLLLLDQLTPFYQARIETMTGEQRKLFDTIALSEGPLSPTDIAKRLNISKPASVVTQLRRLQKSGFVENVKFTNKKGTRYQIAERLSRIWRELRSTQGANRIKLFVDFMRAWYSRDELVYGHSNVFRTTDESYPYSQKRARSVSKMYHGLESAQDAAIFYLYSAVTRLVSDNQLTTARDEIYEARGIISQEKNRLLQKSGNILIDLVEYELLPDTITNRVAKLQSIIEQIDTLRKQNHNISDDKEDRHKTCMVCESIAHRLISYGEFERALYCNDIAVDCVKSGNIRTTALNQRAYIKRILEQYNESLAVTNEILKYDSSNLDALSEKVLCLTFLNKQDLAVKTGKQLLAQDVECFAVAMQPFLHFGLEQELLALTKQHTKSLLELKHDKRSKLFSNYVLIFSNELLRAIVEKKTGKRQLCISLLSLVRDVIEPRDITRGCVGSISTHVKETNVLQEMFSILFEIFGSDKLEGLSPLIHSLEYLTSNDPTVLERLHPEMRQLVIEIVQEMSPGIKISKEILDSVSV